MSHPAISIILPAYNAEQYITKTISSLLHQTCTDFELLVIDDGSADNTVNAVKAFTDSRIMLLENNQNTGLINTLNKGISFCRGEYIARMDADDICLPERLQLQKEYLDAHPNTAAVAGWIEFIDEHDTVTGIWEIDRKTNTATEIKKALVKENCIAHPSVMIRSGVLKKYLYRQNQQHIEDYDLWLRLSADNLDIEKIRQPILKYRIHSNSITAQKLKRRNFFFKHFNCKLKFIINCLSHFKFNFFILSISVAMLGDLIKGCGKAIKNMIRI